MNLISNNRVSTNALYSDSVIAHGFKWGQHRYVRREGSPGNYRYVYPEDLNSGNNRQGATLFGDRTARRQARQAQRQQRRAERNEARLKRKIERDTERYLKYQSKANDFTRNATERSNYNRRAEKMLKRLNERMADVATAESYTKMMRDAAADAQKYYDSTRLIDDIPSDLVAIGRSLLGKVRPDKKARPDAKDLPASYPNVWAASKSGK